MRLPLGCLGDGDALAIQILPQAIVQFCETTELEVGHRLLVLLDGRGIQIVPG